jgi:DNA-binding NtrC family response regulator
VGKELLAQTIHKLSIYGNREMLRVNCNAYTPVMLRDLLFGTGEEGRSFRNESMLKKAKQSTLYLDEITILPPEMQKRLLDLAVSGEFRQNGDVSFRNAEIRIIASTNRDLDEALTGGSLLGDWVQPQVAEVFQISPLRERKEDIPLLVWEYVKEYSMKLGKRFEKVPRAVMEKLMNYSWPGNVRELRNVIEQSVILSDPGILNVHMPVEKTVEENLRDTLSASETRRIREALERTGWRIRGQGGAAVMLGMAESTLRYRIRKLGIERC